MSMNAQISLRKEECARGMELKSSAAVKVAQIKLKREEFA